MLKVCLVGHYNVTSHDEGVRNVAYQIYKHLPQSEKIEILKVDVNDILKSLSNVKKYNPDIIHYIFSPTLMGIFLAKGISNLFPRSKSVLSAPHPDNLPIKHWMSLLRPNIVLVQSYQSEKMFQLLKYETKFLPNGVNIKKFSPVGQDVKDKLRDKYDIDPHNFVVLHVGSIKSGRNLHLLKSLQKQTNVQVLIIGSTSTNPDEEVYNSLRESGCIVHIEYFKNIEEIYALSDCYIFPTVDRFNCIETPLSVLEAMACNLPVISTNFGALPRLFKEGNGLYFTETGADLNNILNQIQNEKYVQTRDKVVPYSWENIVIELIDIYDKLLL